MIKLDYIYLDYLTSIIIGLFIGSFILFIGRIMGYPLSAVILAIIMAPLVAAFLYNPSDKKNVKHRALRCTTSSMILCFIFSIFLVSYYIPKFSSLLMMTNDVSFAMSIIIVLLFTIIGGVVLGSLGGSIGRTIRDVVSVVLYEKDKIKK